MKKMTLLDKNTKNFVKTQKLKNSILKKIPNDIITKDLRIIFAKTYWNIKRRNRR